MSVRNVVVLPAPFRPTSRYTSPSGPTSAVNIFVPPRPTPIVRTESGCIASPFLVAAEWALVLYGA